MECLLLRKYHQLCEVFGGGKAFDVHTEGQLEIALKEADENSDLLHFIEIHLDRWDCNDALRRAGLAMAMNNRLLDETEAEHAKKVTIKDENVYMGDENDVMSSFAKVVQRTISNKSLNSFS